MGRKVLFMSPKGRKGFCAKAWVGKHILLSLKMKGLNKHNN